MGIVKIITVIALVTLVTWTNHWAIEEGEVDE